MSFSFDTDSSKIQRTQLALLEEELRNARRENSILLEKVGELSSKAELYHQAVDNSPNPIFSIDAEGIIQTWNPACKVIFLYDTEMVGSHYKVLLDTSEQREFIARKLSDISLHQRLTNVDLSYRCQDGTVREMVSRIYPLHESSGHVNGYVFANTDVTERNKFLRELELYKHNLEKIVDERTAKLSREIETRQQMQEALKSSNDALITILNSIEVEISVTDFRKRDVIFINKLLQTRIENGEYKTVQPVNLFCHDYQGGMLDSSGAPDVVQESISGKSWAYFNTDVERWYLVHEQAIKWIDGRIVRLQVASDITERQRIESEQQRVAKLESIGMLAGGIAHDFNNLLTGIMGSMSLLRVQTPGLQDSKLLNNIEKATSRASELTNQLLTFSKGGAPIRKPTSIVELINESIEFAIHGSSITYDMTVEDDLKTADVDAGQITQVFHNLVLNAVQAMPHGGKLTVSAQNVEVTDVEDNPLVPGDYIQLTFRDCGPGISRENLSKIFDPYFSTKNSGSGLGLATTHTIIKRHGGHISAHSDNGAVFTLFLPAVDGEVAPAVKVAEVSSALSGYILVMDDEELIRDVIASIIRQAGCDVVTAPNGEKAIELYQYALESDRPFDAVILDLTIRGGMGGLETFESLRKLNPDIKAIVSSGYSNNPIMAKYKEYGFIDVVTKPYRLEEIHEVLRRIGSL